MRTRRSALVGSRRRTRRAPIVALELHLLRDQQYVTEPLVLDHRPLVNIGQPVVPDVGQSGAVSTDLDAAIGILVDIYVAVAIPPNSPAAIPLVEVDCGFPRCEPRAFGMKRTKESSP